MADDDLRHRYAEALARHMTSPEHKYDGGPAHGFVWDWECCADAVLDMRDAELEQLKDDALAVVAESAQERNGWRERAENAEAENARIRALHPSREEADAAGQVLCVECAVPAPCKTRRTLDDQEADRG